MKEALALEKLLQERKCAYDKKIYEGQDHLFKTNPLGADVQDARKRTLAFFGKHLKPQPIVRGP